jgi:hypothetical protein
VALRPALDHLGLLEQARDAAQRGAFAGECRGPRRPLLVPVLVDDLQGERLLGLEEVVKAALADVRAVADLRDADVCVAPVQYQLAGGLQQPLAGCARSSHPRTIRPVNYLLRIS